MKLRALGPLSVGILGLVLAVTFGSQVALSSKTLPLSKNAESAAVPTSAGRAELHPQIREAIAALRRAKEHMEHAAHDFGGHRVAAIKAADEAIRQLEECQQYDKD